MKSITGQFVTNNAGKTDKTCMEKSYDELV